jgi:sterol 24-C-methyltransferase
MKLPVTEGTFDAAFHVEAIEHSPDRVAAFKEICRSLKPGGYFAGFDWVITKKCDLNNPEHVRIKKGIEVGNGVADLKYPEEVIQNLKDAGFEVLEHRDTCDYNAEYEIPWYDSLDGRYLSLSNFKHTPSGRWLTNKFVWALETVGVAPKGTLAVHNMLIKVAVDLVDGGRLGIFSPSYFYLCRKPENPKEEK